MSRYQHPTITFHPLSGVTTCEAPIIPGSNNCITGNSWKHLLSSNIEDDQSVTMHRRKQFSAPESDDLNLKSNDN